MNGGGGDAPPGSSGGEFLLSLLQKRQQQRQPQQQQTQQQTLSLDPAVAAVGPTVPYLPPWSSSSNGRDLLPSHPWSHNNNNNSPPLPPHFLGLPQNHWLPPGNQSISGDDLQRLGFPVTNSNHNTVHNPVQQEPNNLVFGSFNNNSATPKPKHRELGLGNGFDRNQNRQFNPNSNSNSNSSSKEWRGKQYNIGGSGNGNYRSTPPPQQETRRQPQPPPPGFSRGGGGGGNWDYGNNRRKGIEHNVDKEKGIYSDEDAKLRVSRMVDHPGPAARTIVHSASVKDLHIDDGENEDDFGQQLVDSLLHEDESHDKKDKKQPRNFHDKVYLSTSINIE